MANVVVSEMEKAAYHEAAHAVLGLAYGWTLGAVGIVGGAGEAAWADMPSMLKPEEVIQGLVMLVSGRIAETIHSGAQYLTLAVDDGTTDASKARQAAKGVFGLKEQDASDDDIRELIVKAEKEARTVVNQNWHHVKAVAEALLMDKRLSGQQVCALLGK